MLRFVLPCLGLIVAHLPRWLLALLSRIVGWLFFHLARRRRRVLLSNLSHFFPDLPTSKLCRLGRLNATRLIEMGLFSLASPFLSTSRIRRAFHLSAECQAFFSDAEAAGRPTLLLIPHGTLTEAMVFLPYLLDRKGVPISFGVLYRPFKNRAIEDYVRRTRGRFGVRLLSRKTGLFAALKLLQHGGCVGLLFDQNAGNAGALALFGGRIASTTTLPDLLRRHGADTAVCVAYPDRTALWKATIHLEQLEIRHGDLIHSINHWLETKLRGHESFRTNWLWCHNRWKMPAEQMLDLTDRKSLLHKGLIFHSLTELPKNFRVLFAIPKGFYDFDRILAATRSLRAARPDARITIFGNRHQIAALEKAQHIDTLVIRRRSPLAYCRQIFQLRREFFDLQVVFSPGLLPQIGMRIINIPIKIKIELL